MAGLKWRRLGWAIIAALVVLVPSFVVLGARRVDIEPPESAFSAPRRQERTTSVCAPAAQVKTFLEVECDFQPRPAPPRAAEREPAKSPHIALDVEPFYPVPALDVENTYPEPVAVVANAVPEPEVAPATAPTPQLPVELPKLVALTFDTEIPHGAEARRTITEVLDVLRAEGVRATFFVVGVWAQANPDTLRRLIADGHEVANHSLTHQAFVGRSSRALRAELDEVADLVLSETGASITPLFRPPYGCIDEASAQLAREDGYQVTGWTGWGRDAQSRTTTPEEVIAAAKPNLHAGETLLLHTNHWVTAAALPTLLHLIARRGLEAVPVSELLQRDPTSAARLAHGGLRDCTVRTAHLAHGGPPLND